MDTGPGHVFNNGTSRQLTTHNLRSRLSHVELAAGFQAEPCTGVKGAWRCP